MKTLKETKKITLATLKAFAKRNEGKIYYNNMLKYNEETGESDTVEIAEGWARASINEKSYYYQAGISSIYTLGKGKDSFKLYEDDEYEGIEVSNCHGVSILAVKKITVQDTEKIQHIPRFSIVKHENKYYMLENRPRKPLLINGEAGMELRDSQIELEVIKYPAQLAGDYLRNLNTATDGKKYDRVKEQRDEALKILKDLIRQIKYPQASSIDRDGRMIRQPNIDDAEKAIKSTE